jgi:TonB-dependent receptor
MGNIINNSTIGGGQQANNGGTEPFVLEETTFDFDNYRADQQVYATYAMLDLPFVRWFRIVGGARFEANDVDVRPYNVFTGEDILELSEGVSARGRLRDRDILPSLGLIFSPTDKMNVRFSGTRTVARPEFRELAPFAFTDFVGGVDVIGNPELVRSSIWNADFRWEWFPSASEVVAASAFYKHFADPIEQVIVPRSTQVLTYRNARAANLVGAEIEFRKNLEFVWKKLSHVSVGANAAYSYSRVGLRPSCVPTADEPCDPNETDISTSRSRPLQGQSPIVANAFIDYDNRKSGTTARLMYNVVGRKIAYVGAQSLPDVYEQPWHQVDLNVTQRLYKGLYMRAAGLNLVDARRWYKQGNEVWRSWRRGAQFWLGFGYDF